MKVDLVKCTFVWNSFLVRYHAYSKETGKDVAIKVTSIDELHQICTELIMQKSTLHKNIVAINDCYNWDGELFVRLGRSLDR